MRQIGRLGVIAVIAVMAAGAVVSIGAVTAAPSGHQSTTRDPSLPPRPTKLADLFIADSYPTRDATTDVLTSVTVDWFCPAPSSEDNKDCKGDSQTAFTELIHRLDDFPAGEPTLLRVGKARDDCKNGDAVCSTGVPPRTECTRDNNNSPFCAFRELKKRKINLGVIVGARDAKTNKARLVKDIAWQACQIHREDRKGKGEDFYDFLFLDQAKFLDKKVTEAVKYINEGMVMTDGKWQRGCGRGWDVITNDNDWQGHRLDTQAWGHAKNYGVAKHRKSNSLWEAAKGRRPVLTRDDKNFINKVNGLNPPDGLTTGAVLRVEVTNATDALATRLTPYEQCTILGAWAQAQTELRFASLFPLYNHGDFGKETKPYSSFAERTFLRQLELIADPKPPYRTKCPSSTPDGSPGDPVLDLAPGDPLAPTAPPPTRAPAQPPPPVVQPPVLRPPDVMSFEPTNLTCHSARLNGWVNPHGSTTTYHFEYWKTGDVNTAQSSGFGNVGAGSDRVPVARVVDGLQRKTQYTGKLMASNAGGRGVSQIFSFTTPGC